MNGGGDASGSGGAGFMRKASIREEILAELDRLGSRQQRRVLDFARALSATRPRGKPGKALLAFAGTMSPDEAHAMALAIEEGCEKVNPDEW
jgi:hypothetical protein